MKASLLTILLFCTILGFAINKPYAINLYKEEYRANNKNWSIGQNEKGLIYVANDGGLLEFDGVEWHLNKLTDNFVIRSLAVKSYETIFTGGYQEFGRWDREPSGKLKYTSLSSGIDKRLFHNDDFWKIRVGTDMVYFQSFNAIYMYDYNKVARIPFDAGFLFLMKVRDEYLVQGMHGALYRLMGTTLEKIDGSDFFSQSDLRVILPYGEKGYLLGTAKQGFYCYDGKHFDVWNENLNRMIAGKEPNCGLATSRGTFMFGTLLDGVYEVDSRGEVVNHLSTHNLLQNNTILDLFEDDAQNTWIGMDRGIATLRYIDKIDCYTAPRGNIPSVYDALCFRDKFFLATNQGVYYLDHNEWNTPDMLDRLKLLNGTQGQAWRLRVVDGKLFCCHNSGLKRIHPDLKVTEEYHVNTGVYDISEITYNGKQRIVLATYNSIRIIDPVTAQIYVSDKITEPIASVESDHLGNIWLEHFNRGIYRCRLNNEGTAIEEYTLYGGDMQDEIPYKLKSFKVGGRMVLYGDKRFLTYDDVEDRIVPNNVLNHALESIEGIKTIVLLTHNEYWALGTNVACRFQYDGYEVRINELYSFDSSLSLVNNYENITMLNDSTRLICLDNGFLVYHKQQAQPAHKKELSSPYISVLQATNRNNGEKQFINMDGKAKVPHRSNTLLFRFFSKEALSEEILFRYKLDELDKNWSEAKHINHVSYERLPPGEYCFNIQAIDKVGRVSEASTIRFTVLRPCYQTTWAYVMYAALLLLILYAVWVAILRRYRNLHLQKIRNRETNRLRSLANKLQQELYLKNAEQLTQASFIIQKNELIFEIKERLEQFRKNNQSKEARKLIQALDEILRNVDTEEDWKTFLIKFEAQHTHFFKHLKSLYPQLTTNDLRVCACLKLGLGSKDIASLMNLSVRAVENNRYRLRKKLNLEPSQNLNDFIMAFE